MKELCAFGLGSPSRNIYWTKAIECEEWQVGVSGCDTRPLCRPPVAAAIAVPRLHSIPDCTTNCDPDRTPGVGKHHWKVSSQFDEKWPGNRKDNARLFTKGWKVIWAIPARPLTVAWLLSVRRGFQGVHNCPWSNVKIRKVWMSLPRSIFKFVQGPLDYCCRPFAQYQKMFNHYKC